MLLRLRENFEVWADGQEQQLSRIPQLKLRPASAVGVSRSGKDTQTNRLTVFFGAWPAAAFYIERLPYAPKPRGRLRGPGALSPLRRADA